MKEITLTVKDAITKWCASKKLNPSVILSLTEWDNFNKCFCFVYNNMYHGVEENGHIHT